MREEEPGIEEEAPVLSDMGRSRRPRALPRPVELARVVAQLRREKGWSQNELSRRAGLSPAAVSRLLTGERKPRLEHLLAMAAALEVSLERLAAKTEAEPLVARWKLGADATASTEGDSKEFNLDADGCPDEASVLRNKIEEQAADHVRRIAQLQKGRDRALEMANKYYVAWETLRADISKLCEEAAQNQSRTIDVETLTALHDNAKV